MRGGILRRFQLLATCDHFRPHSRCAPSTRLAAHLDRLHDILDAAARAHVEREG